MFLSRPGPQDRYYTLCPRTLADLTATVEPFVQGEASVAEVVPHTLYVSAYGIELDMATDMAMQEVHHCFATDGPERLKSFVQHRWLLANRH